MGIGDTIRNKTEEIGGKVKQAMGDATDNPKLQAEGAAEQAGAKVKQAGEAVKNGVQDAGEAAQAAWSKATN
ncbi:CsbD family protein [Micropruina sp.]|uniref:CsbD family protein n=1 Tax=Micropruina sp. TaxID=2737536 RepID=UPI0039E21609